MGTRAERRRKEKAASKAESKGEAPPERRRKRNRAIALVSIVALVGGIAYLVTNTESEDCPGHWHATFAIAIDGERVRFPQPPYNMDREGGQLPMSLHMHRGNEELLHFEPARPRCVGIQDTLEKLDVKLRPDELTLSGAHEAGPHGGTYAPEGNKTLRLFIEGADGELREPSIRDVLDYQLRDGEKMLIAYGTYGDDEIRDLVDQIGMPNG